MRIYSQRSRQIEEQNWLRRLAVAVCLLFLGIGTANADNVKTQIYNASGHYIVVRAQGDDKSHDEVHIAPGKTGNITVHIGVQKNVGFKFNICESDQVKGASRKLDCAKHVVKPYNKRFRLSYGDKDPLLGNEPGCGVRKMDDGFKYTCGKGKNWWHVGATMGTVALFAIPVP